MTSTAATTPGDFDLARFDCIARRSAETQTAVLGYLDTYGPRPNERMLRRIEDALNHPRLMALNDAQLTHLFLVAKYGGWNVRDWDALMAATPSIWRFAAEMLATPTQKDLSGLQAFLRLDQLPGWAMLTETERGTILGQLGATRDGKHASAHSDLLRDVLSDRTFLLRDPADQVAELRAFLQLPFRVFQVADFAEPLHFQTGTDIRRLGPPKRIDYRFPDGRAHGKTPSWLHQFSLDHRILNIVEPVDRTNAQQLSAESVAAMVARLPPSLRAFINGVDLSDVAGTEVTLAFPWAGALSSITIPTAAAEKWAARSSESATAILGHEVGHLWAKRQDSYFEARWQKAMTADGNFPSTYAKEGSFRLNVFDEDIAETFVLYHMTKDTPDEAPVRALFPNRLRLLSK